MTLPFGDKRDFDEAKKGFIAEAPFMRIMADADNVAWDMASYQWLCSPHMQFRALTVRALTGFPHSRPSSHLLRQGSRSSP